MEKFFKLSENKTTVKTEVVAGITTFLTMAYILSVNPSILSATGMDTGSLFTATALASAVATLAMALIANLPFALAPGMGMNAFFAFTVVIGMGYSWQFALTAILVEGLIFMVLTLFNVREAIVNAIPANLKKAISAGIGLFIAFIGLQNSGIIANNDATLVSLGGITSGAPLVALIGIVVTGLLYAYKVPGALLLGMLGTTLIGIPFGVTKWAGGSFLPPDLSSTFFKFDFSQIFTIDFLIVTATFFFVDVFDTVGTFVGCATQANMLEKDGQIKNAKRGFFADAIGTLCGAIFGTSAVTTYVESSAGISQGGRTGLTSVVTAGLFVLSLFLAPIFLSVPSAATAPALVIVGLLMMAPIKEIEFEDFTEGIPAFLCIIMMPFAYSIADGIMFGIVSWLLLKVFSGRHKEVPIFTVVVGILFLLKIFFV
ncbi:NCS2 family permease [Parasphaerochaeta coccoides]|uniref:Xanthine/uracil/vitamin C permease n=1 Tax=Parasphaerochaeta coccoides (strain ATCC BAA-1237 / DSM 17374 / SPN1) TaxID=760011 RepID=F4GIL1_PARC1|nr:NCS2 family permease [Parasphaerochaeta coccoides]AEC02145.1 Xanthine/uracil/vitamin C permease [Parasphaerochaeta coccoides DSM 17374]